MQTVIKINYPNIINFNSILPIISNMLMQKVIMKYEDVEEQKNIQPEVTPCEIEILTKNIMLKISQNYAMIGLNDYFDNDTKDEILGVIEGIFRNILGIENIMSIGFQHYISMASEEEGSLDYLLDYLIDSCESSPFSIFRDDKIRQAEIRLLVDYDSYRLNVVLTNDTTKAERLEAYFQYLFENKGLMISKMLDYKQIDKLFERDQENFIKNMGCLSNENIEIQEEQSTS